MNAILLALCCLNWGASSGHPIHCKHAAVGFHAQLSGVGHHWAL